MSYFPALTNSDNVLLILFRCLLSIGSLSALVPVVMPVSWMAATHRWLGLRVKLARTRCRGLAILDKAVPRGKRQLSSHGQTEDGMAGGTQLE